MDSTPPLVSVITIFLNAGPFIREAIDSVITQTCDNWELLLVDDGSTDGSTREALDYAAAWPGKVHYFEHPGHENRGMSASRNRGIAEARGKFVAFLDADDVWLPQHLEVYVATLSAHPAASMVYGNTQYWYSWTGRPEDTALDFIQEAGEVETGTLIRPPQLLPRLLVARISMPSPCSLIVRRDALLRIGGFENAFKGAYEDQVFLVKMFLNEAVVVVDTCLDRYRQHPASSTAGSRDERRTTIERQVFLEWVEQYLLGSEIGQQAVWRALRTAQWRLRNPRLSRLLRVGRRLLNWPRN